MMKIEDVLRGEGLVFEGFLVSHDNGVAVVQLHPGLNIELTKEALACLEEATDPVSGRTYVKVVLKPDADIRATFSSRLARLASKHSQAMPFALFGAPQDDEPFEIVGEVGVAQAPGTGGGGGGGGWVEYPTAVMGERATRSRGLWGWTTDDRRAYSGTQTDRRTGPA